MRWEQVFWNEHRNSQKDPATPSGTPCVWALKGQPGLVGALWFWEAHQTTWSKVYPLFAHAGISKSQFSHLQNGHKFR